VDAGGIILVVLIAAAVIAWAIYADHKRKQMWRDLAARYGLHYDSGDPLDLTNRYQFNLFQQGHSQEISNTLSGTVDDVDVALFDFQYTTGSGKHKQTHHYSALMMGLPCSGQVHIRPESFFDRIFSVFGWSDINFEYERFNRAFRVTGPDKKFAYDICHSAMMEFLLEKDSHCWEIHGDQLLLYSSSLGTFDAEEVDRCLKDARAFRERLPTYLLEK